jgi:hypothetical protein
MRCVYDKLRIFVDFSPTKIPGAMARVGEVQIQIIFPNGNKVWLGAIWGILYPEKFVSTCPSLRDSLSYKIKSNIVGYPFCDLDLALKLLLEAIFKAAWVQFTGDPEFIGIRWIKADYERYQYRGWHKHDQALKSCHPFGLRCLELHLLLLFPRFLHKLQDKDPLLL